MTYEEALIQIISPWHEETNWSEKPRGYILSHKYFQVQKEEKKICLRTYEDDNWEKGIYVIFTSLNDIEWIPGDRWMKAKKIGK